MRMHLHFFAGLAHNSYDPHSVIVQKNLAILRGNFHHVLRPHNRHCKKREREPCDADGDRPRLVHGKPSFGVGEFFVTSTSTPDACQTTAPPVIGARKSSCEIIPFSTAQTMNATLHARCPRWSSVRSPSLNFWRCTKAWFQASRKKSLCPRFQLYAPYLVAPRVSTAATASRNSKGIRSKRGFRSVRRAPPAKRRMLRRLSG